MARGGTVSRGRRIPLGNFGACRLGHRWPEIGRHHLAEPTHSGQGGKLADDLSRREDLFKDFIVAASKSSGEALMSHEPDIQELINLYAMISGMRVGCLPRTVEAAEQVMRVTIDTYEAPNKTLFELHELMKSGNGIDPLKDFSSARRPGLQASLDSRCRQGEGDVRQGEGEHRQGEVRTGQIEGRIMLDLAA